MSTYVMQYQVERMHQPIDTATKIFALATFGGVALYGLTASGLIAIDMFSKLL